MDHNTLESLLSVWQPGGDARMLELILDGAIELCAADTVASVLNDLKAFQLSEDAACKAARLCLDRDDAASALELLGTETDERGVWRAQALLALSRPQDAKQAYDAVIRSNPTLENMAVSERIEEALTDNDAPLAVNVVSIANRWSSGKDPTSDQGENTLAPHLVSTEKSISFKDVGGLEDIKSQIRRKIITPFQKPSLFKKFRRKVGGGVLLYGPPGCGKTLLARATAGECNARFINIQIAEILDMYMGESEKRLSRVFAEARRETPSVLFFDEIEALAGRRHYGAGDSKATLVSTFLSELDGFDANNDGVLVLAATNIPWAVDSAFRRPGRFDRVQFVPPPDRDARAAILGLLLNGRPGAETIKIEKIADSTSGFSGADLQYLIDTATDFAIEASLESGNEVPLTMAHAASAMKEVKPTTLEWLTTARNYTKYSNTGGQYDDVADFLTKFGK